MITHTVVEDELTETRGRNLAEERSMSTQITRSPSCRQTDFEIVRNLSAGRVHATGI